MILRAASLHLFVGKKSRHPKFPAPFVAVAACARAHSTRAAYSSILPVLDQPITAENQEWIVETLRGIAEIVIWGDQNSSDVFEFFMEKDMMKLFERILFQDSGHFVSVQVLQTLSILFENISSPGSLCMPR